MERDPSNYCLKHDCGECCVRGWKVFVTEEEMQKWKEVRPEILSGISSGIFDNKRRWFLKQKKVESPEGKLRDICIFYDFQKKCFIHADKPEMCQKFSCWNHPYFFLQFLSQILQLG